jgi:hypothetical protein
VFFTAQHSGFEVERKFLMPKHGLRMCLLIALSLTIPAQSEEWRQLFNGKDLTGWKHVGPGGDVVENGLIRTYGGMGLLYWTGGKVGDCVIRVTYKMRDHNSNSGVFIRIPEEPTEEWMPVHRGYEVQIDNEPEKSNEDEYHVTGTLYSLTNRWRSPASPARNGTRLRSPLMARARLCTSTE